MRTKETTAFAVLLALTCSAFWGSNVVVGRAVSEEVPPFALAFWRNTIALAILAPFTFGGLQEKWPLIRANLGILIISGTFGMALFNALVYFALGTTTAINAALVMSLCPVAVPLLALFLLQERLRTLQMMGILVSLAGVAIVVSRGDSAILLSLSMVRGDLLMVAAMFCWSLYSILVKYISNDLDSYTRLSVILGIAVLTLLPFYLWESTARQPMPLSLDAVTAVSYLGLFATTVALLFHTRATQIIGVSRTSLFQHFVPVFAAVFAIVFLEESLATFHFVGAGLIAAGIYFTNAQ